ncbi:hypothetical protein SAMN04489716_6736 [Actinoplanes derwentensis]|uniref:Uncharacterized protein n=1 Tax=Actinoplanes derwentensis TaxID=113562 RepID=A0A1H2CTP0_9ACTN|nr:hypothetical protein SAMN04489716_6736 [Actinoplanes derwentensis]
MFAESANQGHSSFWLTWGPSPQTPRHGDCGERSANDYGNLLLYGLVISSSGVEGCGSVLKKLLIIAGVVGVAALVVKKVKASSDERALWHEATTAPDLR